MSTEPDYNFTQPAPSTSDGLSLHLPFALLSLAIAVIFIQQTANTFKTRSSLFEGKDQLNKAVTSQGPALQESAQVENRVKAIVEALLILAKTDDDAKAIVAKYGIQQQGTPSTPMSTEPPK